MIRSLRTVFSFLLSLLAVLSLSAQDRLSQIERQLRQAPVQEKIYVHMDNTCYFKGDTIWYKAYVVRADSLTYTDMSRITYVELLTPDGMVVERQQIVTSPQGWTCGNFVLQDSLYSGYFELRAYTRWMLNFRVTHRNYNYFDRLAFYDKQMADDFFRDYGTLYSRVFPVYERPTMPGAYDEKYVVSRPKMRLDKELKERLHVTFYPEGGHLIAGSRCRVAFEACDEEGQQVQTEGLLGDMPIRTEHQGRGVFTVDVPERGRLRAEFSHEGKDYRFSLPDVEERGCALMLDEGGDGSQVTAALTLRGVADREVAVAVLCRGVLKVFRRVTPDGQGRCTVNIDKAELPTGVCDLIVIDGNGQPLADRLFFVNHHDYAASGSISVSGLESEYQPLEQTTVTLQAPPGTNHLSVAIRDGATDDPTYDTGNIMTDLLLSSELQGFIPHADYYFESDDTTHRRHLDLLMMVQGWRRYDYHELTDPELLRYQPETAQTVVGGVYPYQSDEDFSDLTIDNLDRLIKKDEKPLAEDATTTYLDATETDSAPTDEEDSGSEDYSVEPLPFDDVGNYLRKQGRMKREVMLRAELAMGNDVPEVEMLTHDGGRFEFSVPPFYGDAVLFMMACNVDDKEAKLNKYREENWNDEKSVANYYVKRDLFFPIFPKKYSYYQSHQPEYEGLDDVFSGMPLPGVDSISKMDRTLRNVTVKAHRCRSLHAVDYSKPAYVIDTHEIYNLGIDYGLSTGYYRVGRLPQIVARMLLGTIRSYGNYQNFCVRAQVDGYTFYRDYFSMRDDGNPYRSEALIVSSLALKRQDKIRVYTDLEPRNPDLPRTRSDYQPDVQLDFKLVPDGGVRPTNRDRRLVLHGFTMPDHFYHRDYSHRPAPAQVKDYRRTLYWNPNAPLDKDGRFTATFYNNNKTTRMRVSAAGLTGNGQPVFCK